MQATHRSRSSSIECRLSQKSATLTTLTHVSKRTQSLSCTWSSLGRCTSGGEAPAGPSLPPLMCAPALALAAGISAMSFERVSVGRSWRGMGNLWGHNCSLSLWLTHSLLLCHQCETHTAHHLQQGAEMHPLLNHHCITTHVNVSATCIGSLIPVLSITTKSYLSLSAANSVS
jgi:hypothetical protein